MSAEDSGDRGTPRANAAGHGTRVIKLSRQEKRSETVARAILHDVGSDGLGAGVALPPQAVMLSRYGVGRSTLREALRILEVNGLVRSKPGPGGGSYVETPTPQVIGQVLSLHFQALQLTANDLFRARLVLDPLTARLAARCHDEPLRQRLESAMHHSETTDEGGSLAFHRLLIEMVEERVIRVCALALFEVIRLRYVESASAEVIEHIHDEHIEIGKAVLAGDGDTAERLMYEHLTTLDLSAFDLDEVVEWR